MARSLGAATLAVALLSPCAALAAVPATHKTADSGSGHMETVTLAPDTDLHVRVESSLPDDVDDLVSSRYAITDEIPSWLAADEGSVEVTLVTPAGTAYDLTDAFETFVDGSSIRVQCDTLREELPAALVEGSNVVLEYSGHVGPLEGVTTGGSYGAHLTLSPTSGSAKTEAGEESVVAFEVISLDLLVTDEEGSSIGGAEVAIEKDGNRRTALSDDKGVSRFVGIGTGTYQVSCDGSPLDASVALGIGQDGLQVAVLGDDLSSPYVEEGGHACGATLSTARTTATAAASSRVSVHPFALATVVALPVIPILHSHFSRQADGSVATDGARPRKGDSHESQPV